MASYALYTRIESPQYSTVTPPPPRTHLHPPPPLLPTVPSPRSSLRPARCLISGIMCTSVLGQEGVAQLSLLTKPACSLLHCCMGCVWLCVVFWSCGVLWIVLLHRKQRGCAVYLTTSLSHSPPPLSLSV